MNLLFTIAAGVVLVGGLVFVHELGHFLVAKWLGVKVVRFSIGFGPKLLGFTRGETEYQIAALPLGGFVKMAGDEPGQEVAPEDRGRGFLEQAPWKRLLIAAAGPAMNLAFPFLVYLGLHVAQNGELVPGPVVGSVAPASPAAAAGLRPGDRIRAVTVPGRPAVAIRYFTDLPEVISPNPEVPLTFQVERGGAALSLTIIPAREDDSNALERRTRGVVGITPSYPAAVVAPAPGAAGPVQPFDLVTRVGGAPVRHAGELEAALAAARCAPVALEVRRGAGKDQPPVALPAVPTCRADGSPALLVADPTVSTFVDKVEQGSPAERAGLVRGDALASVNGRPVHSFRELNLLSQEFKPGTPVRLALADGRELSLVPEGAAYRDEDTGEEKVRPVLGFAPFDRRAVDLAALTAEEVPLRRGLAEMARISGRGVWDVVRGTALGLGKILSGDISFRTVGGPIMLFSIAGRAAEQGTGTFFFWMGVISVNLGLMNLLPIPVLDGGHIVTAALEGLMRRRLSLRVREAANWVGLVLLLTLMVFVIGNDIMRLRG